MIKLLERFLRPTFRMTLSQFGVGMVIATGLCVALVAYLNAQATVRGLTFDLFNAEVTYTAARAADYSNSAQTSLALTRELLASGVLPPEPEAVGEHLVTVLASNSRLSSVVFGAPNGDAAWSSREDGRLLLHQYTGHDTGEVIRRTWEMRDGERVLVVEEPSTYDARVRPWFKLGMASEGARWTKPYLFVPENLPGISLTEKVVSAEGSLIGVLTTDFRLSFLSRSLEGLDKGYGTQGVIFDESGFVIGHSDESKTQTRKGDTIRVARLSEHGDPLIRRLAEVDLSTSDEQHFVEITVDGREYALAIHQPKLNDHGALAWWTAVFVPEEALLSEVRTNAIYSVLAAFSLLLVAVVLSVFLSRRISESFYSFYGQMERVGRLDFATWDRPQTRIVEVERLGEQLERLKAGLQSFARYVPVDLVRQVIAEGGTAQIGGSTREVTILFTDIERFTTTIEETPPSDLLEGLGQYLLQVHGAVQDRGGNVTAYLGDGVMALFGAPVSVDDHAVRACHAALACREQSERLEREALESGGPVFPTRFGLNTGEVLVGNIGAPDRFEYTAVGDAVNTASRVEGLNKQYGTAILVGEQTRASAESAMVFRSVERVRMKGKRHPVLVHELIGARDDVPEATVQAVARYEAALALYWSRDFEAARSEFEAVDVALGGDPPSRVLAEACVECLASPPADDWDGTRVMRVK